MTLGESKPFMIPGSPRAQQREDWQREYAEAITDPNELLQLLGLAGQTDALGGGSRLDFGLRVPRGFVQRMVPGNPDDPLLLQVLPVSAELRPRLGFTTDPLNESEAMPTPGVLHKYRGRVLLTLTGACAVNCRYCFRRHFPYSDANPTHSHWLPALDYISGRPDISEVILSGGDPLVISDERFAAITSQLGEIEHLKRLRVHTRLPVVIPSRVTDGLISALTETKLKPVMVLHVNHPNEIDSSLATAAARLADAGVPLLNQSVLLRTINDCAETLTELSERLFAIRVLPYYLHQLDPVDGAAHFHVEDIRAIEIARQLRERLPGYLVPRLVRERIGAPSKVLLDGSWSPA